MRSVFDSSFKYTPSFETDVRKTFQRVRRRQAEAPSPLVTNSQCNTNVAVMTLEHFKRSRNY
ncbi:MAG: hypothetical protein K0R53_298 [Burkholderiales bacterium]|jgi:hypothetical protein|nr:hypothetical protein [Burkholderiales bacterium]